LTRLIFVVVVGDLDPYAGGEGGRRVHGLRWQARRIVLSYHPAETIVVKVLAATPGVARANKSTGVIPYVAPVLAGVRFSVLGHETEAVKGELALIQRYFTRAFRDRMWLPSRIVRDSDYYLAGRRMLEDLTNPPVTVELRTCESAGVLSAGP
jgi:hypothetical protein